MAIRDHIQFKPLKTIVLHLLLAVLYVCSIVTTFYMSLVFNKFWIAPIPNLLLALSGVVFKKTFSLGGTDFRAHFKVYSGSEAKTGIIINLLGASMLIIISIVVQSYV